MDVVDFARKNAVHQYAFLKDEPGFPCECALSSQLLASYLTGLGKAKDVELVYGTFGAYKLFHSWVEWRGVIIDYTLFQFLAYKEKRSFYLNSTPEQILQYAFEYHCDVVVTDKDEIRSRYHKLTSAVPALTVGLRESMSYMDFLEIMKGSPQVEKLGWYDSFVKPGLTFEMFLQKEGYRLTKRLFTKWAIVAA